MPPYLIVQAERGSAKHLPVCSYFPQLLKLLRLHCEVRILPQDLEWLEYWILKDLSQFSPFFIPNSNPATGIPCTHKLPIHAGRERTMVNCGRQIMITADNVISACRTLEPCRGQNNCDEGQICSCPLHLYFWTKNMEEKLLFEISLSLADSPIQQTWKIFHHNISLKWAVRINGRMYVWLKRWESKFWRIISCLLWNKSQSYCLEVQAPCCSEATSEHLEYRGQVLSCVNTC